MTEGRCWTMADDEDPDCPIGCARCVRPAEHDGGHVFESYAEMVGGA